MSLTSGRKQFSKTETFMNFQNVDIKKIKEIREHTLSCAPLIHCITNPISINDCANTVLLTGAKPIMAEHPDEVAGITAIAGALAVNLGNITDARMKSIIIASQAAADKGIPVIIDMVGITCSTLRLNYAHNYLERFRPSIIKGNLAEIKALCNEAFECIGIDAVGDEDVTDSDCSIVCSLAAARHCVVMATGKTDIISDGINVWLIKNGSPKLPLITGTGCMLNVLTASFLPSAAPSDAAVTACIMLGVCGEIAERTAGSLLGSYHIALLDSLSSVTDSDLAQSARVIRSTAR